MKNLATKSKYALLNITYYRDMLVSKTNGFGNGGNFSNALQTMRASTAGGIKGIKHLRSNTAVNSYRGSLNNDQFSSL
jgi:hypothetical protein